MSRRAIKCAYGGEIEFIPPRMRHSALYAPYRTNEDHTKHDAFTPVAATGQERTRQLQDQAHSVANATRRSLHALPRQGLKPNALFVF